MFIEGGRSLSLSLLAIVEAPRSKNSRKLHHHHSKHQTKTTLTTINQLPIHTQSFRTYESLEIPEITTKQSTISLVVQKLKKSQTGP